MQAENYGYIVPKIHVCLVDGNLTLSLSFLHFNFSFEDINGIIFGYLLFT